MNILNNTFEGPYANESFLKDQSGVYVILGKNGGTDWHIVDVGESARLKNRVETHDRRTCWASRGFNTLGVAVHYTTESSRMYLANQIRLQLNPPCGER